MKYIKLFESFSDLDPELKKALKEICCMYKDEVLGSIVHPCESFDDGSSLKELASKTDDSRIKSILGNIAQLSKFDCEGDAESIFDYMQDEDCDYIAKFLGLAPLNLEEDWTDEEEDTWSQSHWGFNK